MLWCIITFILNGIFIFTVYFSLDNDVSVECPFPLNNLKMPSVDDLIPDDDPNNFKKKEYIAKVICPAYHYFEEKKEVEWYQKQGDKADFLLFFSQLGAVTLQMRQLLSIGFTESRPICGLISIALSVFTAFICHLIYKKTSLSLKGFPYSAEELKEFHKEKYKYCKFEISEEKSLNNYLISESDEYLKKIKHKIVFRANLRKVLSLLTFFSYLLYIYSLTNF